MTHDILVCFRIDTCLPFRVDDDVTTLIHDIVHAKKTPNGVLETCDVNVPDTLCHDSCLRSSQGHVTHFYLFASTTTSRR
jgi:hypothetical protein